MGKLWQLPGIVVACLILGAPLLAFLGIVGPGAFSFFFAGVALGAVATIGLAGAGAFASATGRPWRSAAVRAAALPLVLTLGVLGYAVVTGGGAGHPIHDVTTSPEDALQFTPDVAAREAMVMPREDVLAIQQEIYPDIVQLVRQAEYESAFAVAAEVAQSMPGWEVTAVDEAEGRIEAVAVSRIFHFVDDIVIQLLQSGQEVEIDIRSRSRMGRSDLGANAARIRAYLAALDAELASL